MGFHMYGNASLGWGFTQGDITKPGPTIQVNQGDTVNLTLASVDGSPHQFFVDYNNNTLVDAGEPASPQFSGGTSIVYSFVADTLGNFTYRCAIHPTVMFGNFKVLAPVPEFPGLVVGPLFVVLSLLAVVLLKRRRA